MNFHRDGRACLQLVISISSLVGASACHDVTAPRLNPDRVAVVASLIRERSGTWLRVSPQVAIVGCGFAELGPSRVRELALARAELPFPLPQIDSVKGPDGRLPGLTIVSVEHRRSENETIAVACLVPTGFGSNHLALAVKPSLSTAAWLALEQRLHQAPSRPLTTSDIRPAHQALHRAFNAAPAILPSMASVPSLGEFGRSISFSSNRPASIPSFDIYFGEETPFLRKMHELDTVFVWGAPSPPYPFDLDWFFRTNARRSYSLSEWCPTRFIDSPNCSAATEVWYAWEAAAQEVERDGDELNQAWSRVADFVCSLADAEDPNKTICIDGFIGTETALLIMEGDDRDFDSNERYWKSRFHLYMNPATGALRLRLNNSRIDFIPGDDGSPVPIPYMNGIEKKPMRHLPKDVQVLRDATTGMLDVRGEVYNAFCSIVGRAACPAINFHFHIYPHGDSFRVEVVQQDQYPSFQINHYRNGQWNEIYRAPEHPGFFGPFWLITWQKKADHIRANNDMPDGCMFQ